MASAEESNIKTPGPYTNETITNAGRGQAELMPASAELLRAALDALAVSAAVIDRKGNLVVVNHRWREFDEPNVTCGPALLEGDNYIDHCVRTADEHSEARIMARSLRSVLAGGADPEPLEYACHTPAQHRWFQAWIHGFSHDANRFAVITHQNVTARRLASERRAADERRRRVATIAAGVAHEFNSLLFAAALQLHGHADERTASCDPARARAVELIHQAQSLASALLNLYAGPETCRLQPLALHPWLTQTVTRLARVLPACIRVTTDIERDLPEVRVHALGLEQVVRTLLTNASNALGDCGAISVHARAAVVDGRRMIEIRMSDNGPGIPEHLRSRIFEPGFTTTPQSHRSGLGLAIAAQLLEQCGGSIRYEPVTPTGSTFIVRFHAWSGES